MTDAAFAVMDHEDWSGLLLTYGGIDKAGTCGAGSTTCHPTRAPPSAVLRPMGIRQTTVTDGRAYRLP